jgi:hypothetical protein
MKALSVRAPWWWFILHAGKDIENRDWPTRFRGTIYLHAGKSWQWNDTMDDIAAGLSCCGHRRDEIARTLSIDRLRDLRGYLVGTVDIVDCVRWSSSPWFFGEFGFVLANPVVFTRPVLCKGMLGLFTVPDCIEKLATGEMTGDGIQTAMSADGVYKPDRSKAQAAEVLQRRVPAEGRPGDEEAPGANSLRSL